MPRHDGRDRLGMGSARKGFPLSAPRRLYRVWPLVLEVDQYFGLGRMPVLRSNHGNSHVRGKAKTPCELCPGVLLGRAQVISSLGVKVQAQGLQFGIISLPVVGSLEPKDVWDIDSESPRAPQAIGKRSSQRRCVCLAALAWVHPIILSPLAMLLESQCGGGHPAFRVPQAGLQDCHEVSLEYFTKCHEE